ncbi:uncharacterized protein VTP21DRAFT_7260 [Calcarisporiella thermophila]|uniref:uncharacterized protein n=1 Tax=Calcarisporiella thermophila TaxID=911321 RepID=UPI0037445266
MVEAQRKALEALMGLEAMGGAPENLRYYDSRVCRSYLCGFCPQELFRNTKADIGPCPNVHSDRLKQEYEDAKRKGEERGFEPDFIAAMERFTMECDRKIRAARARLEKTQGEEEEGENKDEQELQELEAEIAAMVQEAEALGEEGKVTESMALLKQIEVKKEEQAAKKKEIEEREASALQKKLRVCEVCGAFLSVLDSDKRLADHFQGKVWVKSFTWDTNKSATPLRSSVANETWEEGAATTATPVGTETETETGIGIAATVMSETVMETVIGMIATATATARTVMTTDVLGTAEVDAPGHARVRAQSRRRAPSLPTTGIAEAC